MAAARYDAIIVGGGHNGLVAAGLLAKRGARVTVLERREQVGGAAITEQPWGPDFKVTTLAILFMAELMGLPGAIIAVPAAATAQILVREILLLRRGQP